MEQPRTKSGVVVNADLIEEMKQLIQQGWSQKLIAEFFQLSRSYVCDLVKKHC